METDLLKNEKSLSIQESYFDNLLELGLMFQNSGNHQKAFEVYKKGIERAELGKTDIVETMLGLLE
ncbi:MAG: hypothetical protein WCQ95_00395 [Bacteroidota bacterium]